MKRLVPVLAALLLAALPAHAETWFPDVSGTVIHRDPFCMERTFSLDSFFLPALQVAPGEIVTDDSSDMTQECTTKEIITADASYTVCPHCYAPSVEIPESTELYYNPAGGTKLHRNPEYRPLKNINEATSAIPQEHCNFCGPRFMTTASDTYAWNATAAGKALILPGLWTTPSEEAIHYSAAADAAYDYLLTMLPKPRDHYAMSVAHYDQVGPDENHATFKVIVTTAFREPVCIVYVDALTGEIYQLQWAEEYDK